MKAIKCELCGSSDLIKQGDFFVCQYCGTKYELEAAKKLFVELDNSKQIANLYQRAQTSREIGDFRSSGMYYKQILDLQPDDWKAFLYSYLYGDALSSEMPPADIARMFGRALPHAYDLAVEDAEVNEASNRIVTITNESMQALRAVAEAAVAPLREHQGCDSLTDEGKAHIKSFGFLWESAKKARAICLDAISQLDDKLTQMEEEYEGLNPAVLNNCKWVIRQTRFNLANEKFFYKDRRWETTTSLDYLKMCAKAIKEVKPDFVIPELSTMGKKSFWD